MKKPVKILVVAGACVVAASILHPRFFNENQLIKQAIAQIPSTQNLPRTKTPENLPLSPQPQIPDLKDPELSNKNPPPRLVGNRGLSIDNFISKEQAVGVLPKNARLISAELVPWGQHETETLHGSRFHEASPLRMVWVVKVAYPEGIKMSRGFYGNATATIVHDAQTGQFIDLTISCAPNDYKDDKIPWAVGPKVPMADNF